MSQSLISQLEALRTRALDSMERTKGTAGEKLYEGMVTGFDHALNRLENDKLSAAAPDLLAALKDCLDALGDDPGCCCDEGFRCEDCEPFRQVQERADAAIKKAGG